MTSTTTELKITVATFTPSLLKTGGDTHHHRFVLQTVGENLGDYERRLVTQTNDDNLSL
jgi:hypothetical protein